MMKKLLQILLGFILILVLAYFSFLEVSEKIKDDLLSKAQTKFVDKGIVDVQAAVEGEGFTISRTLTLTGTVGSEKEKARVASLIESLEGVATVNNNIRVKEPRYSVPIVTEVPKVQAVIPKAPSSIKAVTAEVLPKEVKKVETVVKKEMPLQEENSIKKVVTEEVTKTENQVSSIAIETSIAMPKVPVVTQKMVEVPTPVPAVVAPMTPVVPVAMEVEENKNIEIEGVK